MATIQIRDYEAADDLLPSVCMKCGEPATTRVTKNFSWYPRWIVFLIPAGLLIAAIVAMILTRKMTIRAPFCEQHRRHWMKVPVVSFGGFFLVIATVVLSVVVSNQMNDMGRRNSDTAMMIIVFGCLGSILAWLIALIIVSMMVIRPIKITERSMSLIGVSEQFVEVLWKERDAAEAENEQRRARRRSIRDDRDDDLGDIAASRGRGISEGRFRE